MLMSSLTVASSLVCILHSGSGMFLLSTIILKQLENYKMNLIHRRCRYHGTSMKTRHNQSKAYIFVDSPTDLELKVHLDGQLGPSHFC